MISKRREILKLLVDPYKFSTRKKCNSCSVTVDSQGKREDNTIIHGYQECSAVSEINLTTNSWSKILE